MVSGPWSNANKILSNLHKKQVCVMFRFMLGLISIHVIMIQMMLLFIILHEVERKQKRKKAQQKYFNRTKRQKKPGLHDFMIMLIFMLVRMIMLIYLDVHQFRFSHCVLLVFVCLTCDFSVLFFYFLFLERLLGLCMCGVSYFVHSKKKRHWGRGGRGGEEGGNHVRG